MGGELVELQVERVVGGGQVPQQSVRPAVQIAGRVAARVVAVHRPELAVDGEVVVAVVEVEQADPAVPARRRPAVAGGAPVAVQEAADVGGLVAGAAQPGGQHVAGIAEHLVAGVVGEDTVVVAVLAGQLRRPGRAAERGRDREVRQPGAAVHQSERLRHQLAGEAAGVLVVGDDHDDVGPLRGGVLLIAVRCGARRRPAADRDEERRGACRDRRSPVSPAAHADQPRIGCGARNAPKGTIGLTLTVGPRVPRGRSG